jgi:excinuclease ABC subunit A
MADIEKLVAALQSLVDQGNTVVVIEHNLDVIREADCVVDLGPEGGERGGRLVAWGPPAGLMASPGESYTARFLKRHLASPSRPKPSRSRKLTASPSVLQL